jgi:uncharacterized protein YbjT (DUF2867 family)
MALVLIVGGSKGVGFESLKTALSQGHRVRAFARTASQLQFNHPNLEKFDGDALKPVDIVRALIGVDAVIQTLGIRSRDLWKPVTLFSQATRVLLQGMQEARVRRLIALTGFGAGDSRAAINPLQRMPFLFIFGHAYDDKSIQEELIKESQTDWTIVRPGVLTPGPASGRYKVLSAPPQWRNGIISRADVAAFMVEQLTASEYVRKDPVLVRF